MSTLFLWSTIACAVWAIRASRHARQWKRCAENYERAAKANGQAYDSLMQQRQVEDSQIEAMRSRIYKNVVQAAQERQAIQDRLMEAQIDRIIADEGF